MTEMEDKLQKLLRCILETREEEIDSMAWDLQIERCAEMTINGEDIGALLPAIKQYLDNSPDCNTEFRALVAMLQADADSKPDQR